MSKAIKLQAGPLHIGVVAILAALAWRFGVRPLEAKAMQLKAEADSAEQVLVGARESGDDLPPDAATVAKANALDERLKTLASVGQRQNRLHEEVARVAQECGVRLASLEPRAKPTGIATTASMKIASATWSAEASGSFDGLTHLLDVIETKIPLARVQSFRLVSGGPAPGAPEAILTMDLASYVVAANLPEGASGSHKKSGQEAKR